MPTQAEMRATLENYLAGVAAGDAARVVALFSDDVSVEDPVGGPAGTHVSGRNAVLRFFTRGFERSRPEPVATGPIRTTTANAAAMPFRLRLTLGERRIEVDVIDVVEFAANGAITRLRAFWNLADAREIAAPARDYSSSSSP